MQSHLQEILEVVSREHRDPLVILRDLLRHEQTSRQERKKILFLKMSGLPYRKTLADFDVSFQPSINERNRLLHHCHILNIKGRSYSKLRERQESGLIRKEVNQEGGV